MSPTDGHPSAVGPLTGNRLISGPQPPQTDLSKAVLSKLKIQFIILLFQRRIQFRKTIIINLIMVIAKLDSDDRKETYRFSIGTRGNLGAEFFPCRTALLLVFEVAGHHFDEFHGPTDAAREIGIPRQGFRAAAKFLDFPFLFQCSNSERVQIMIGPSHPG